MHVLTLDGLVIVLSLLNLIMLKQQLQQKLQQKLSPQQIQLIRLLELPAIELEERIKHELEDNPALEEGKEIADDFDRTDEGGEELAANEMEGGSETDTDLSLGDYMSEDDIPDYKLRELNERAEKKEDVPFSVSESLNEYLLQQLGLRDLPEKQVKIAEYIIGNIDDDGYLRRDLSAIADDLVFQAGQDVTEKEIETVLAIIQDFDPADSRAPALGRERRSERLRGSGRGTWPARGPASAGLRKADPSEYPSGRRADSPRFPGRGRRRVRNSRKPCRRPLRSA